MAFRYAGGEVGVGWKWGRRCGWGIIDGEGWGEKMGGDLVGTRAGEDGLRWWRDGRQNWSGEDGDGVGMGMRGGKRRSEATGFQLVLIMC